MSRAAWFCSIANTLGKVGSMAWRPRRSIDGKLELTHNEINIGHDKTGHYPFRGVYRINRAPRIPLILNRIDRGAPWRNESGWRYRDVLEPGLGVVEELRPLPGDLFFGVYEIAEKIR